MSNSIATRQGSVRDEGMNAEFHLLRAQVENAVTGPAVILVTSAEDGDGKSLTAHSLAECLARSGHKTALLDASQDAPAGTTMMLGGGTEQEPDSLRLPDDRSGLSRGVIEGFFSEARSSYDFTIVDASSLMSSHRAMALASAADGVLLSVRLGRAPTENDHMTVRLLEECGTNVVGVVASSAKAIGKFENLRAKNAMLASGTPAPAAQQPTVTAVKKETRSRRFAGAFAVMVLCFLILTAAAVRAGSDTPLGIAAQPARTFVMQLVAHFTHPPAVRK